VRASGVVSRLFRLPFVPGLAHATNLEAPGASSPRGILAPLAESKTALRFRSAGGRRVSVPRRPGPRAPLSEHAADGFQIDQRIAPLGRAQHAARQPVADSARRPVRMPQGRAAHEFRNAARWRKRPDQPVEPGQSIETIGGGKNPT